MSLEKLVKSAAAFFSQMEDMAKWAAQGIFNKPDAPEFELFNPFDLEVFRSAFNIQDEEKFLSEEPITALTEIIDDQIGRLPLLFPEGLRIHFIAMPCNPNGKRFKPSQLNDKLSPTFPYLTILKSDPDDKSGLCTGFGSIVPCPLPRILPEEINKPCSFVVKYPDSNPNDLLKSLQTNRDYLVKEFRTVYTNLQAALKPQSAQKKH